MLGLSLCTSMHQTLTNPEERDSRPRRTRQQVWLPFRHNCGHQFVIMSAAIAIRMTSVCADMNLKPFGLAQKSYRTFGQGGKSYPAYTTVTTARSFLPGAAGRPGSSGLHRSHTVRLVRGVSLSRRTGLPGICCWRPPGGCP